MNDSQLLYIPKIRQGIVIDHVPAGLGLQLLTVIRSYPGMKDIVVTLGINYKSSKLGTKDLLKLKTTELDDEIVNHIALIAPGVSIKRITDYDVDKRFTLQVPESIVNKVKCRNPNCVTNFETNLSTLFTLVDAEKRKFRCKHCERIFDLQELEFRFVKR